MRHPTLIEPRRRASSRPVSIPSLTSPFLGIVFSCLHSFKSSLFTPIHTFCAVARVHTSPLPFARTYLRFYPFPWFPAIMYTVSYTYVLLASFPFSPSIFSPAFTFIIFLILITFAFFLSFYAKYVTITASPDPLCLGACCGLPFLFLRFQLP